MPSAAKSESPEAVADLLASHTRQMEALMKAHNERIEAAQTEFAGLVSEASQQMQALVAQAQPEKKPEAPEAVWSDGYLVLNRSAAGLIDDLLSRTGEVLSEVGKLVSTKPQKVQ